MTFVFDKNYNNKEQVREWLPAFSEIREEMTARQEYPYNDSFVGAIPGLAGPNEVTGIYLLQCLYTIEEEQRRVAALYADGFKLLELLSARKRFSHVAIWREGHYVGGTGKLNVYDDARVEPNVFGKPRAVLPKGKRNGYLVESAQVLVKP